MKKIIFAIAIAFVCVGSINAQDKDDAYTLVELMVKPTFADVVKQFSGMIKADKVDVFTKEAEATYPKLLGSLANIYSAEFTQQEIKELIKFYSTDLGKKLSSKQTSLSQKGMKAGQSWGMKLQDIMTKYQ